MIKYIFVLIFAGLHLIAAIFGRGASDKSRFVMICGAMTIIVSCFFGIIEKEILFAPLVIGGVLIIDSAIYTGYKQSNIQISHHLIRTCFFIISFGPLIFN